MIERWLQITCDHCGETDNSVMPHMTVVEFMKYLKQSGWRRVGNKHACSKECAGALRE